ncbi:D-arabinono-1,4-lactone oxidase [Lysobacter firmicutimachus]|uniref:D-arabinono-1,4-lactone oxidase n=1 Tax=Lysobacter firmicutimachus TaxID=1792846 RepID=A0AAU8MPS2_9GAMM
MRPARTWPAHDEDAIAAAIRVERERGGSLRAIGAAHSSNEQIGSAHGLLRMRDYCGLIAVDRERGQATVRAGTPLAELGPALFEHDLALPNYGDIALQTLGGAIATGTHGSGETLPNLSQLMIAAELIDGRGERRRVGGDGDDALPLAAAQVALGSLGVLTAITIRCPPSFEVERREFALPTEAALECFDELAACNRSLDFYWYPRRDEIKLRVINPPGGGTRVVPGARLLEARGGDGHELIPVHSGLPYRFEESEFALPRERGLDTFRAVRRRILQRWRATVGWRVLYRTVAADSAWLSPAHARASATISLHQNASLPWREFFEDLEPVFAEHCGRPHWAKKHGYRASRLAPLYPHWRDFLRMRERCDPDGVFLNPYLRDLFGVPA